MSASFHNPVIEFVFVKLIIFIANYLCRFRSRVHIFFNHGPGVGRNKMFSFARLGKQPWDRLTGVMRP